MFKPIFSKVIFYAIIIVIIVPVIILILFANTSRKQAKYNAPVNNPTGLPLQQDISLPSKEDVVITFCNLVDEGRISEAVSLMNIDDDIVKQSWGVSLNNFSSFKLINIKKSSADENGNSFEVDINVVLKKNLTDLPVPNYGWVNGINKKWINLIEKEPGKYIISEIATGP